MSNRIFDTVSVNCLQLHLLFSWQPRETWEMPTTACPCEGCLAQAGGCLGHPSWETKRRAACSARVGAPAIAYWGKEQAQKLLSAPGMRGQSVAVPLQRVLGPTLSRLGPGSSRAAAVNVSPHSPTLLSPHPCARMVFLFAIFHAFLREIAQAAAPQGRELMSRGQPPQEEPSPGSTPSIPHSPRHCSFLW